MLNLFKTQGPSNCAFHTIVVAIVTNVMRNFDGNETLNIDRKNRLRGRHLFAIVHDS